MPLQQQGTEAQVGSLCINPEHGARLRVGGIVFQPVPASQFIHGARVLARDCVEGFSWLGGVADPALGARCRGSERTPRGSEGQA